MKIKPTNIYKTIKRCCSLTFASIPSGDKDKKPTTVVVAGDLNGDATAYPAKVGKDMEKEFHVQFNRVKESSFFLISSDTQVEEVYRINRSFRRGYESRAIEQGVSDSDIELVNRWRKVERKKGQRPRSSMREYYLEIRLLRKRLLRYASKL